MSMARQAARTFPISLARANTRNRNRYRASSVVKAAPPSRSTARSSERMRRLCLGVWEAPQCRYDSGTGHTSGAWRGPGEACSSAPHLLDDLFGGLAPDEGLGIVVPVLGPQLYRLSQRLDAREHAWRRRRSVRSLNQSSTRLGQELEVGGKW